VTGAAAGAWEPEDESPEPDALTEAAELDSLSQPEPTAEPVWDDLDSVREHAETLAQKLQKAAAANAAVPDAERARRYLVDQLAKATTEATVVDLWRRASKKGYWPRDDAELNALGAAARQRIAAAELEPAR